MIGFLLFLHIFLQASAGPIWMVDGTFLDPAAMQIDRRHDPAFLPTGPLAGTDGGHEIGDTINFWAIDHSVSPPVFYLTAATCRYVGEKTYIFVEDSQWGTPPEGNFDEGAVLEMATALEDSTPGGHGGIVETEIEFFGQIPDEIDNDPKVYFLVLDIRDGYDPTSSEPQLVVMGFFSPYNMFTEQEAYLYYGGHSNECEMLYIDCFPGTMDDASFVSSHELVHLIQWGISPFSGEELWVMENQAQAGVYICGYPAEQVTTFLDVGGTTPIKWTSFSDDEYYVAGYGAGFLWFGWLFENYGGKDFIWNSMHSSLKGLPGVSEAIKQSTGTAPDMESVLRDWMLANWIDDTGFAEGKYGYQALSLSDYDLNNPNPGNRPGLNYNGMIDAIPYADSWHDMNAFAGNYYRINDNLNGSFRAEGSGIGHLEAFLFESTAGTITELDTGSANDVALPLSETGDVLLLCNSFATLDLDVSAGSIQGSGMAFTVFPDPCQGDIYLQFISSGQSVALAIFDTGGRHIETIQYASVNDGEVTLTYQGASELATGIYFYRFAQGSHVETGKFAVVR